MNICLTTYFDKNYELMGNMSWHTIKKYAATFGYACELINTLESDRPKSWNKILVIKALFERGHDFVFWVDSDAMFVNFKKDIAYEIEDGKDLYLVQHQYHGGCMPNFGIFLIRNCLGMRELLDQLWNSNDYINHPWWENAAFLDVAGLAQFLPKSSRSQLKSSVLQKKADASLQSKTKYLSTAWNSIPQDPATSPVIIQHFAGIDYGGRLIGMAQRMTAIDLTYFSGKVKLRVVLLLYGILKMYQSVRVYIQQRTPGSALRILKPFLTKLRFLKWLTITRITRRKRLNALIRYPDSKLNLGCGRINLYGFINIDEWPYPHVHYVQSPFKLHNFKSGTVDLIIANHLLDKVPPETMSVALKEWYRVLKPQGRLNVSVVDSTDMGKAHQEKGRGIMNSQSSVDEEPRKGDSFFNRPCLTTLLREVGFKKITEGNKPLSGNVLSNEAEVDGKAKEERPFRSLYVEAVKE